MFDILIELFNRVDFYIRLIKTVKESNFSNFYIRLK